MKPTQEQLDIIISIAKKLAPKYRFAYYDISDIEQEGILLGLDALNRWDGVRPLENFIFTHIRNRLGTLKRDKYYRLDNGGPLPIQEAKKRLLDAVDITICAHQCWRDREEAPELFALIDKYLPSTLRGDYLRYMDGAKLQSGRKAHLLSVIKSIVENKYDEIR
jgi:hypothetical protein